MQHHDTSTVSVVPTSISVNFPFDTDLTDLILTMFCDIDSLQSFILSSKFAYNVFTTRRASILCAVVSNHLGPATPPAMRLLKVMTNVDSYWHGWLAPLPVSKLPIEDDFQPHDPRVVVTMQEAHILATNHNIVKEFESLYSWRKKDPRSSSSRLTPHESEQFQTALYRVWFVCTLYGRSAPANRVGKSKSKHLSEILRDLGRAQSRFLQNFTHSQREPLFEAWDFMVELAAWAVRAEFFPQKNEDHRSLQAYIVWSGPSTTLQAFQGKLMSVDRKFVPARSTTYQQFYEVFNAAGPVKQPGTGILQSPHKWFPNTMKCQQCTRPHFDDLWSESNWSYLRGIMPPSEIFKLLELPWWNSYIDVGEGLPEYTLLPTYRRNLRAPLGSIQNFGIETLALYDLPADISAR